jgi:hypothetical protein
MVLFVICRLMAADVPKGRVFQAATAGPMLVVGKRFTRNDVAARSG